MFTLNLPNQTTLPTLTPFIDIFELADKVFVFVDMPGVAKEETEVKVAGENLTIRGRHQRVSTPTGVRLIRECPQCDYYRALKLSDAIDVKGVEAEIKDGVLTIVLPKKQGAQPIDVPIVVEH